MREPAMRRAAIAIAALAFFVDTPGLAQQPQDPAYNCVVEPSVRTRVGVPVVGLLTEILVSRGDFVETGQQIAILHDEIERATVAFNEARAANTAAVEAEQARLKLALQQLARGEKLAGGQTITAARVDELRAEVAVGQQNVKRAQMEQELARLELERSRVLLEQRTIRSPVSGLVIEQHLSPGEYAHQEAYILEIAGIDPLHVIVILPTETYHTIKVGQTATVTIQAPIGVERNAQVDVVDKVLDAASGTYGVRLVLDNPNSALPAGVRCTVRF